MFDENYFSSVMTWQKKKKNEQNPNPRFLLMYYPRGWRSWTKTVDLPWFMNPGTRCYKSASDGDSERAQDPTFDMRTIAVTFIVYFVSSKSSPFDWVRTADRGVGESMLKTMGSEK
jgi:hypothetical protein